MSPQAEMRILNLYKGQPLKKAVYALELMRAFQAQKTLELRVKIVGLKIG